MTDQLKNLALRVVTTDDLHVFFAHQRDAEANLMVAFTAKDPSNRAAFDAHWSKILADPAITIRTITWDGDVAGSVLVYPSEQGLEVSYWLGREYWGQGVATLALGQFLQAIPTRPLFARVVKDNLASLRVLQKNGFVITGESKGFANARSAEVEEYVLELKQAVQSAADAELEPIFARFSPEVVRLAQAARQLIASVLPDAIEQPDLPANMIAYGMDRTYRGLICGIMLYREYINIIFAQGARLPAPQGLLRGTGKKARHIRVSRVEDLQNPAVRELLMAAREMQGK